MVCDGCCAPVGVARSPIGPVGRGAPRRRWRLALAVASAVAFAALPKCPLCLVAYLSAIGAGAASLVGAVYPVAGLAIAAVLSVIALRGVRRGRSESRPGSDPSA